MTRPDRHLLDPLDALAVEIGRRLPGRLTRDAASSSLVTYRCGGPISLLVRVSGESDLVDLAESLAGTPDVPVIVVGRGSNLLVAESGFAGLAVLLEGGLDRVEPDPTSPGVRAGGAAALPVVARRSAAAGLGGLEFYVGIPGSVGGAVRMNAGGHGKETRDVLRSARVVDLRSGSAATRTVDELHLGYRSSAIGDSEVVVEADFAAILSDPSECAQRVDEVVRWRREHQPGGANAGSVFRNPPGDTAGRLVDAAGLKGRRVGGVQVSEKHANFFVADPGATAQDVRDLVDEVRSSVERATGVRLECELRMVGFDERPGPQGQELGS